MTARITAVLIGVVMWAGTCQAFAPMREDDTAYALSVIDDSKIIHVTKITGSEDSTDATSVAEWIASKLGLAAADLTLTKDTTDALGLRHVRLQQTRGGIPVFGGDIIVHLNGPRVYAVTGSYVPALHLLSVSAQAAVISEQVAVAAAAQGLAGRSDVLDASTASVSAQVADTAAVSPPHPAVQVQQLVIPTADGAEVVYSVKFMLLDDKATGASKMEVLVSASSGQVLSTANVLQTVSGGSARRLLQDSMPADSSIAVDAGAPSSKPGTASKPRSPPTACRWDAAVTGTGQTLYSGSVRLDTTSFCGGAADGNFIRPGRRYFTLTDTKRRNFTTRNLRMTDFYDFTADAPTRMFNDRNTWGNGKRSDANSVAADAHFGAQVVYDYYKQVLGRDSVDDDGLSIVSKVHAAHLTDENVVVGLDNAFWDGSSAIVYGDGSNDGNTCLTSQTGLSLLPLAPLDVVAHEITHGVTQYSANLAYRRESGGLNEATSDIMASAVVQWAHERGLVSKPWNWLIGSQLMPSKCNQFLRNMKNPRADAFLHSKGASSFNCWEPKFALPIKQGGVDVHYSSGPANRAHWLISRGLSCGTGGPPGLPAALGVAHAAAIHYRALTVYFTSNTNYQGARAGLAQAAIDLYGASAAAAVHAAYDLIGAKRADGSVPTCLPDFATTCS